MGKNIKSICLLHREYYCNVGQQRVQVTLDWVGNWLRHRFRVTFLHKNPLIADVISYDKADVVSHDKTLTPTTTIQDFFD